MTLPIAFYTPLKGPNDPVPSGDREVARLLIRALRQAGFAPETVSALRTRDKTGNTDLQNKLTGEAAHEIARLTATEQPFKLWLTYHCYYKAPDLIGPAVARALGIPYVIVEGSRAPKRADGPWAAWHRAAEAALNVADLVFASTQTDRDYLSRLRPPYQQLLDLPPFIDLADWPAQDRTTQSGLRLLTVAMMREGDKLASYRLLAQALDTTKTPGWHLDIVGDGPARPAVEAMFAPFAGQVTFHGRIDGGEALAACYASADLFVWPAVNEAYGMVFLEAQASGCPILAGNEGGVASVVASGRTGLLVPPRDPQAFAAALDALLSDPDYLARLSAATRPSVEHSHSLTGASDILRTELMHLIERGPAKCAS